jgi:hypothetical protein
MKGMDFPPDSREEFLEHSQNHVIRNDFDERTREQEPQKSKIEDNWLDENNWLDMEIKRCLIKYLGKDYTKKLAQLRTKSI